MIKTVIIFGLAAFASAQQLRISPAVVGQAQPGQQQVIQLGRGGSQGPVSSYHQSAPKPAPYRSAPAQTPFQTVPKPQSSYQSAPKPTQFQSAPKPAPYQSAPKQPSYQSAPKPAPFQSAPKPAPYQSAPKPATYQSAPRASQFQSVPKPTSFQSAPQPSFAAQSARSVQQPLSGSSSRPAASAYVAPSASFKPKQSNFATAQPAQPLAIAAPRSNFGVQPNSYASAPISASYSSVPAAVSSPPSYASNGARSSRYGEAEETSNAARPQPYSFQYESEDEYRTKVGRQEAADEQGVVSGSYSIADVNGLARVVNYIADVNGFRATVKTNEPGTLTSEPANVKIESSAAAPAR